MILEEARWIFANRNKLCSTTKKFALDCYRPAKFGNCMTYKPHRALKQRFKSIPVIVQVEKSQTLEQSMSNLASSCGCKIVKEIPTIDCFTTKVNTKNLEALANNKYVKKVWYDREFKAFLDKAIPAVASDILSEKGLTGKEVVVAVLDTGIYEHPDLKGRIIAFKDIIKGKKDPYDDNGHGTHVAGAVASNGSKTDGRFTAPAPDSKLVGVKVLDKVGGGSLSGILEGIQWCIENKEQLGIDVMNLSLGSEADMPYTDDPVCMAVEKAWEAGIVVCVAAGNSGPQSQTIGSPGIHPKVITVGALDNSNSQKKVADYSSRGPTIDGIKKPDILAPGTIVSLRSPGSLVDRQSKNDRVDYWYTTLSGTSMATPICSGIIAQILEENSSLTPDEIKEIIVNSSVPLENEEKNAQGAGVINGENINS
ncbi:S8 family peptidase [Proteinivorax hydrogeniformans]|uniref:S8 family peptidase n=1 Tax=Proteinivorax hydrogeniformans TaxID=1826727 RepID=A0AAU8HTQ0_9FIRM